MPVAVSTGADHVPTVSGPLRRKNPATEAEREGGSEEPDSLSFRPALPVLLKKLAPSREWNFVEKKLTCGEPTAGVAHTFPGGIQGPGRGVTAHQRAPPEQATGPARLAHPGFGLEHPGYGPKTGKS